MKKVLFNIFMAITMWYGPQFVVGFVMGFIFSFTGMDFEQMVLPLSVAGVLTGIASEAIYWGHVVRSQKREVAKL